MNAADAEEYTQALGQVVAGGYRQIALGQRLGVPKALGLTIEAWVKERLGGYVQTTIDERRTANQELKEQGYSVPERAQILGVSERTIQRAVTSVTDKDQKITGSNNSGATDVTSTKPLDVISGLAASQELRKEAERQEKKQAAAEVSRAKREASRNTRSVDGYAYCLGDARQVFANIDANSVHLVLTDPPYGDEAEPLYRWLAEWSARVLVDGGSLICFTGQSRLDRDIQILGEHLRYWWLLAMRHNQAQRLPGKFVMAEFKPVLWFVKDHRRGRTLVNDVLRPDRRDKAGHDWGQGDGGVQLLIEQLTDPDDVILDPFAGTGEWGRIASRMGRQWMGCDLVDGGATIASLQEG